VTNKPKDFDLLPQLRKILELSVVKMLLNYLTFFFFFHHCISIKHFGIKSKTEDLHVGRTTELSCDFLKWRQEQLYSVTWSIKYPGVKTNFYEWSAPGTKSKPTSAFIEVDEHNSNEKAVTMKLLDGQEEEVSICCQVNVLKDSGYGSTKPLRKEKCKDMKVVEGDVRRVSNPGTNLPFQVSKPSSNSPYQVEQSLAEVEREPRTFWSDPVKHRDHKKGVPCQSYVLLESKFNQGSVIRGQLSEELIEDIPLPTKTADNRLETSEDVVTVLNILGYHGYSVVGVGNSMDNRLIWTLERKYYEFHKDELL